MIVTIAAVLFAALDKKNTHTLLPIHTEQKGDKIAEPDSITIVPDSVTVAIPVDLEQSLN